MRFQTAFLFLCLLGVTVAAHAETINFTETTTASGTLNGVSFTDVSLTISGSYDTSGIFSYMAGTNAAFTTPITYTLSGLER